MNQPTSPIRTISDTARWVGVYRARESERPDAVFRDRFAALLAGERGETIAASMPFAQKNSWSFVARTWLIDRIICEQVRQGADMVVNLAAGLDTRPYRLDLPSSLQWIEVDLPEILAHKEEILRGEEPACALERVRLDLSNASARRELFTGLGRRARRALVVTEGLLVYMTEDDVAALARDLAATSAFQHWVVDLASPALLRMLVKRTGVPLARAGLPLRFAPESGPDFFTPFGWMPQDVRSIMHAAARLNRLPLFLRLMARISSPHFQAGRPWAAACLLSKVQE